MVLNEKNVSSADCQFNVPNVILSSPSLYDFIPWLHLVLYNPPTNIICNNFKSQGSSSSVQGVVLLVTVSVASKVSAA
jgi:hypothetical protein